MIRALLLLGLLLASPARAQDLAGFAGEWQGEGTVRLGDEPAERFRCRLRLEPTRAGPTLFQGRCATAQAAQSFTYLLSEDGARQVTGENRAATEDGLPAVLVGRVAPGLLHLEGGDRGLFELRREGVALRFTIAGHDSRGPARGEAVLQLRD